MHPFDGLKLLPVADPLNLLESGRYQEYLWQGWMAETLWGSQDP